MALTQDDIDRITSIVNSTMNANNTSLLNQVQQTMAQQPQPQVTVNQQLPQYQQQTAVPPQYPVQAQQVAYQNPQQIQMLAQQVANLMNQQGGRFVDGYGQTGYMTQYGQMTVTDIMTMPPAVRNAWLQQLNQPAMSPEYDALNQKIDDLTDQLQCEQWKNCKHHSKRKTALKIGAAVVGVGAGAYAIHKFKHRHDHDKSMDALTSLGNRYLDLKYGSDV